MKTSIHVDEDLGFTGIADKIAKSLVVQIYPIVVEGHLGDFNSELTIKMSNNDRIEYSYDCDPGSNKPAIVNLRINDKKVDIASDFSPTEIFSHYQTFLSKRGV